MKINELNDTYQYLLNLKLNSFELLFILHRLVDKLQLDHVKYLNYYTTYVLSLQNNQNINLIGEQANDLSYIRLLFNKSIENRIQSLLNYLPLFQTNLNADLKQIYQKLLESIFNGDGEHLILSQQLKELEKLVLVLSVHPLFSQQERDLYLNRFKVLSSSPLPTTIQQQHQTQYHSAILQRPKLALSRNPSVLSQFSKLSTISSNSSTGFDEDGSLQTNERFPNNDIKYNHLQLFQSRSQPNPTLQNMTITPSLGNKSSEFVSKALSDNYISFNTSIQSIGNDTNPYDDETNIDFNVSNNWGLNTFTKQGTGMKEVPAWLKRLRLHKYTKIFCKLTYDEMMNLTEDYLRSQEVTQGASNKILIEIKKLKERSSILKNILKRDEKHFNLNNLDDMYTILKNVYDMVTSPMKSCTSPNAKQDNECDVPLLLFKIIDKICDMFVGYDQNKIVDQERFDLVLTNFIELIDKCYVNEVFSDEQKDQMKKVEVKYSKIIQLCIHQR